MFVVGYTDGVTTHPERESMHISAVSTVGVLEHVVVHTTAPVSKGVVDGQFLLRSFAEIVGGFPISRFLDCTYPWLHYSGKHENK